MVRLLPLLAALVLVWTAPASASEREEAARKSLEALFNLDYERSLGLVRARIAADPEDFAAYLFEAGVLYWWETSEPGFFKRSPEHKARFKKIVKTGLKLAKKGLKAEDKRERSDAYLVAGLILGLRGQYNVSRGRYLRAYFDARKGNKYLKKCLKIDPGCYDAYLGIGLFNYLTARLPAVLKIASFLIVRGDAERGMRELRMAMSKSRYPFASAQAASNLAYVYIVYEREYIRSLDLVRGLLKEYPNSPYFRFLEVLLLDRGGDWQASHERARALFARAKEDPAILGRKRMSMLCGVAANRCLKPKALKPAVDWFTRALAEPGPEDWRAFCSFYRGAAYDVLGRRDEALEDYRAALAGPDLAGSHAFARRCLKKPCRRKAVKRFLVERSLSGGDAP